MAAKVAHLTVRTPQPDITSEAVDDTFAVAFAAGRAFERVLILGTPSPRPSLRLVAASGHLNLSGVEAVTVGAIREASRR